MAWTDLDSSHLAAMQHDADLGVLHVRFKRGGVYSFRGVPADVASGLKDAESPGAYFAAHIKGKFEAL